MGAALPAIIAFSSLFLLAGLGMARIGRTIMPVYPSSMHAPHWVPVSCLRADLPVFGESEVEVSLIGIDLPASHTVPVY